MEQSLTDLESDLAFLQTQLNAIDRAVAAELGVGSAEDVQMLRLMLREGSQRVGALARARGASVATVSARLDRLEKRGLLTRERLAGDRRAVVATLTTEGGLVATRSLEKRLEILASIDPTPPSGILGSFVDAFAVLDPRGEAR